MKLIQNNGIAIKLSLISIAFLTIALSAIVYFNVSFSKEKNNATSEILLNSIFQTLSSQLKNNPQNINQIISDTLDRFEEHGLKDINLIDKERKSYIFSSNSTLLNRAVSKQILAIISKENQPLYGLDKITIEENESTITLLSAAEAIQLNGKDVFVQLFILEKKFLQDTAQLLNQLLFIIIPIIIIYFIAIYLLSSHFSILIKKIADVTLKFSDGLYTYKLPKRNDEFGIVDKNFRKLADSLTLKDVLIKNLEKENNLKKQVFVNKKDNYQIDVVLLEIALNNYNYLVEKVTSNTVMKINSALYDAFLKELEVFSGQLVEFNGSHYFIIFRGENRIKRATSFVLSIQKLIAHFLTDPQYQINVTLNISAVLHSGVIHYSKFNYQGVEKSTVLGKHKFVTEKMLAMSEIGEITISETIKNELSRDYDTQIINKKIELEGEKDIKIYSLQNLKTKKEDAKADNSFEDAKEEDAPKNLSIGMMLEQTFNNFD